jgi:hypothetical protein
MVLKVITYLKYISLLASASTKRTGVKQLPYAFLSDGIERAKAALILTCK